MTQTFAIAVIMLAAGWIVGFMHRKRNEVLDTRSLESEIAGLHELIALERLRQHEPVVGPGGKTMNWLEAMPDLQMSRPGRAAARSDH